MFQFLFKYPATAFAKGKLVLLGPAPVWLLPVCIAGAALLLGWLFWRRRLRFLPSVTRVRAVTLWALQAATIGILLLLLWQPAISVTMLRPRQNIVAVLVDDSKSMALSDEGAARERQVIDLLQSKLLPALEKKYQVRLYKFDTGIARLKDVKQLKAEGSGTQLGTALHQISEETATLPIGAVVILSDGSDNSGGIDLATLNELRARRLPVNSIGFGSDKLNRDVELESLDVAPKVLMDSRVEARIRLRQHDFAGRRTRLTLLGDGQVLASRDIVFSNDPEQSETIEFNAGKAGVRRIEARLSPLSGETNAANNTQTQVIAVDGSKHRLLYVEGEPRWEYKFLRRAVEDDPAVEIASLLRTTQNKVYRQGLANPAELADGFPVKAEDLFAFQGLIIGTIESGYFTPAQQHLIRDFVDKRGGGVLFLGGRVSFAEGDYNAPPFAELLPVIVPNHKGTFHRQMALAELTNAGQRSLICRIEDSPEASANHWNVLPFLADYQDPGKAKPGAVELAQTVSGNNRYPLLVIQNYGRGRSGAFATGGSWRWRMQQPVADKSQQTFWRQLVRWTAGESPSPVVASVTQARLEDNGHTQLQAEVRNKNYELIDDASVEAQVTTPDGGTRSLMLTPDSTRKGIYHADFDADQTGSYIAEIDGREQNTGLGSDLVALQRENGVAENFHQQQNRELLEKLAEDTGGRYYTPRNAENMADEISFAESGISARQTMDLWNMPIVFFLLFTLRFADWILRRRWGAV